MTTIDMREPGAREYVLVCQLIARVKLEKRGLKPRGPAALTIAREQLGIRGNYDKVQEQLEARRDALLAEKRAREAASAPDAHLEMAYEDRYDEAD